MYAELRPYQRDLVHAVEAYLHNGITHILVQSPTGSGKSVVLAYLLQEHLRQGKRILLVAHKIELIRQLYDHIHRWLDFKATVMADRNRYRYDHRNQVVIASIQSWYYRYNNGGKAASGSSDGVPPADVVVVDEAHHVPANSYTELFRYYADSIILGFTATPERTDGKGFRTLGSKKSPVRGFDALVHGVPTPLLIRDGFLCDYKLYGAERLLDAEGQVRVTAGDYNQRDLDRFVRAEISADDVIDTWYKYANGKKTVLYPVSVALSEQYCLAFNRSGVKAEHIDSNTPARQREAILRRFATGETTVLCQHSIVIEGVDVPDIECVQFLRPTRSKVVWLQAIGRGLRPSDGKDHLIIIDHTVSHRSLPLPSDFILWQLDGLLPATKEGELVCPHCRFSFSLSRAEVLRYFVSVQRLPDTTYLDSFRRTVTVTRTEGVLVDVPCRTCSVQHDYPYTVTVRTVAESGGPVGQAENKDPNLHVTAIADTATTATAFRNAVLELLETARDKGYKRAWVAYRAAELPQRATADDYRWLARQLGYKDGWAYYAEMQAQNSKIG